MREISTKIADLRKRYTADETALKADMSRFEEAVQFLVNWRGELTAADLPANRAGKARSGSTTLAPYVWRVVCRALSLCRV